MPGKRRFTPRGSVARWARGLPGREWRLLWNARIGRLLILAAAAMIAGTIVGMVLLWPGSSGKVASDAVVDTEAAKVVALTSMSCETGVCRAVEIELLSGVDRARASVVSISASDPAPDYEVGDRVRVLSSTPQSGVDESPAPPADLPGALPGAKPLAQYTYSIVDYDRRRSLLLLAAVFAIVVLVAARLRGLLSLVGLGASFLIVTTFVVPAIVAGKPAFLVALVGSLAVTVVMITLTSGLSAQSLAASLGIAASLLFASLLGLLYVDVAHLSGAGDLVFTLRQTNPGLSLQGLVLAGFVIGALGVLADMAVTQASAVMALRRANPELGWRAVYREAFTVGRDHLSATVHTLVFAYVGASLPLLLLFNSVGVGFTDAINGQEVAESIVATLVGAIGIVASVPITTALAALLASNVPPEALPADAHGHHH